MFEFVHRRVRRASRHGLTATLGLTLSLGSALVAVPASAQFISDIETVVTMGEIPPPPAGDGWVRVATALGYYPGKMVWTFVRVGTGATPLTSLAVQRPVSGPGHPWASLTDFNLSASSNFPFELGIYGTRAPNCEAIVEIDYIFRNDPVPAGWQRASGIVIPAGGDQPSDDRWLIFRTEALGQWL